MNLKSYHLKIQNPSGETRVLDLKNIRNSSHLGRSPEAEIQLKDSTLPSLAATLSLNVGRDSETFPLHFKLNEETPNPAKLGDLLVRDAYLPIGVALEIGESILTIEANSVLGRQLPHQPDHLSHWKTCSPLGEELIWLTKKSAETPLSIYIAGETGTGKEVIAHLIHAWSNRASGPFVPLHCGALNPNLAESELFGHIKGAYTGAGHHRTGALLQAHGGTLFLDEVGDLSIDLQVKLLRFLENGEVKTVGSDRVTRADVRILCATHLPLKRLVEEGKFRRDLYYRLASVTLEIPTLRSRPNDIDMLAEHYAKELGKVLSPQSRTLLRCYPWPGNVRELRHTIERAAGLSGPFQQVLDQSSFAFLNVENSEPTTLQSFPETSLSLLKLKEMEKVMILKALRLCHGNRTDAARMLGVARSTLFEMLKRYHIAGPRAEMARNKLERAQIFAQREAVASGVIASS